MNRWQLDCKDVLEWCKKYTGPKFHAMLTDSPYHLGKNGFMSSDWDAGGNEGIAFNSKTWAALSEHLLPGAFIFVFGSSRGWHRLAVAIEDAGFVFHPSLMVWGALQGQGFPKSTRVAASARHCLGWWRLDKFGNWLLRKLRRAPRFGLSLVWQGHRYGRQALKPAVEMVICAQKPYSGRPVDSIVETGAGALFIDGGRVGYLSHADATVGGRADGKVYDKEGGFMQDKQMHSAPHSSGRWPPNFCLVHVPPHICATCDGDGCDECNDTGLVGGCRRVLKPKGYPDTLKNRIYVTVVQDAMDGYTIVPEQLVNGNIPGFVPGAVVPIGCVNLNDSIKIRKEKINDKGAMSSDHDVLVNKVELCDAHSLSKQKLNLGNSKASRSGSPRSIEGHIGPGFSALEDTSTDGRATDILPLGMSEPIGFNLKGIATNGAGESNPVSGLPRSENVGTGTGTGSMFPLPEFSISDAVNRAANGANPVMSRHIITSQANYTRLLQSGKFVAAWNCVESCAARRIGEQSGERKSAGTYRDETLASDIGLNSCFGIGDRRPTAYAGETGTCARFFPQFGWAAEIAERLANSDQVRYCAKASRGERDAGLEGLPEQTFNRVNPGGLENEPRWAPTQVRNIHPTVKPIALCRWLATLLLPPPEYAPRRILVPFAGVASEMIAASLAGWEFAHGIEMSEEYCAIGEARLSWRLRQLRLPGMEGV